MSASGTNSYSPESERLPDFPVGNFNSWRALFAHVQDDIKMYELQEGDRIRLVIPCALYITVADLSDRTVGKVIEQIEEFEPRFSRGLYDDGSDVQPPYDDPVIYSGFGEMVAELSDEPIDDRQRVEPDAES
jgi:hypothetical protein